MSLEFGQKGVQISLPNQPAPQNGGVSIPNNSGKTPYQQNLSQPVQFNMNNGIPSTQQVYSKIWEISRTDPEMAKQKTAEFLQMQNDPSSPYYNPYRNVTNRSIENLAAYGIDTSNIDDNWFRETADFANYLKYDGTTNSPTTPGKKASATEKAAYEWYQIGKANELTKKAKSEWAALQDEIEFWTMNSGRNYSDDEVVEKIYGKNGEKFSKKYPTLAKMDDSLKPGGALLELNSPIGYSKDNVYTTIWRARNGGGTGDWDIDALLNASGKYNHYVEDPDITARLNIHDESTYAPYTVGSTMDDACAYYGMPNFTTEEIASMKPDGSDATESRIWNSLYDADQFTVKAEEEAAKFWEALDRKLEGETDPAEVMQWVDNRLGDTYETLKELDDSTKRVNDLKDTTRAINYSYNDVLREVQKRCLENRTAPTPVEKTAEAVAEPPREGEQAPAPLTPQEVETAKVKDKNIRDGRDTGAGSFTPAEEAVMNNAGSSMWDYMRGLYTDAMNRMDAGRKIVQNNIEDTSKGYVRDYLQSARAVGMYNTISDNYAEDQAELLKYQKKYGDLALYYTDLEDKKAVQLDDGTNVYMHLDKDSKSYVLDSVGMMVPEELELYDEGSPEMDLLRQAERAVKKESELVPKIMMAQNMKLWGGEEIETELQKYGAVNVRVENEKKYLKEHDSEYNDGMKALERAEKETAIIGMASAFLGADTSNLEYAKGMTEYLCGFIDEPPLPRSDKTKLEIIQEAYKAAGKEATNEDISNAIQEGEQKIQDEMQLINDTLAYIDEQGIEIPDNVRKHMQFMLEDYANELQGFKYAEILTDTDPEELARCIEAGKKFEEENDQVQWDAMFMDETKNIDQFYTMKNKTRLDGADFITEDDENTYYYLLGKKVLELGDQFETAWDGEHPQDAGVILEEIMKDSNDYLDYMYNDDYGVWTTKEKINREAAAKNMVDSGLPGAIAANFLSTISTPVESILSGAYMLDRAITGKRLNPDSQYGLITAYKGAARAETTQKLNETFGEGTLAAKMANIGYEIYCNRGDSMMNTLAFGWMMGGAGGITGEFVGSMPMGVTAAMSAAAEAVENGASMEQAWLIAGATFVAETVTEAVTFSNIQEALGTGKELTTESVKDFFREWLMKDGLEEVTGEVANNIIERAASKWAERMDPDGTYASDHQRLVDQYVAQGKTPEEAEILAKGDELKDDLHTAIVSYLSAGTDVFVKTGKAALNSANYYRTATRAAQQIGDSRSMVRHMLDDHKAAKEARSQQANQPGVKTTTTTTKGNQETGVESEYVEMDFPDVEPLVAAEQQAEQQKQDAQKTQYAKDLQIATAAMKNGATESTTAGISAVLALDESETSTDIANAAAVRADTVFEGGIEEMRDILKGGADGNVDNAAVKHGMIMAILGGEESESHQVVQSEEYQNATDAEKAQMLAQAGAADAQNQGIQLTVSQTVQETRAAENTRNAIADGMLNGAKEARAEAEKASAEARQAQEDLTVRESETKAADDARVAATQNAVQNPGDLNALKAKQSAEANMRSKVEVENEYKQRMQKAKDKQTEAERKAKQKLDEDMSAIREQSQGTVAQTDQQRADVAAQQAEAQRIAEEQQAQAQAEVDQQSGKADADKTRKLAEDWANTMHLEGDERDAFIQRVMDRQEQKSLGKIDLTGKVSNAEGFLAIGAFSRKTGMQFELSDDLPNGTRGKYQNGKVYLNANLVRSGQMTIGQALVEASLHEVTHSMENTKNYRNYRKTVLACLYGAGKAFNQDAYDAAIETKKAEYKKVVNQDLSTTDAEKEIIADFARTHLADKDVVQRFMDSGMGGKMRNTLHSINQALKNFFGGMKGEERKTAEYLRKAERQYQKALDEVAKTSTHPDSEQFSVQQMATSMNLGMTYDEDTLQLFMPDGTEIDGVTEGHKITPDMIRETPVGMLINMGLDNTEFKGKDGKMHTQQGDARQMFSDLMNMCARYRDNNLIWEIAGSEFAETFSALKSNSDPQYKTTVDFGTICAKTQGIVDVLSGTMQKRIATFKERNAKARQQWIDEHGTSEGFKPEVFTGLTSKDVMEIYDKTHNAGLSVPCPVCYVFSRWMGVPSLLGQMNRFQNEYVVTNKDEKGETVYDADGNASINWEETSKVANKYINDMLGKYGSKDKIADKKTSLNNQKKTRVESLPNLRKSLIDFQKEHSLLAAKEELTKDEKKKMKSLEGKIATKERAIEKNLREQDQITEELREVEAFNWVTQALCVQEYDKTKRTFVNVIEDGVYKIDEANFRLTPEEVLFDLNRTGEFAGYTKNWKYRTTRGAGMGKAIMPYSGASLGDIINGDAVRWQKEQNPFMRMDKEAAKKAYERAKDRVKQQNLVGGQRFQSTSDFRPEWGLDYVMSFLEMQALGSKVQMYTKVAEAVDFLGSIGADVNLSIMAHGNGFHEATAEEIALAEQDTDEGRELKSRMGTLDGKNYVMEFSDVTGMDYNTAKGKSKKFDNVQMILVGMNDTHIRLALGNQDIDFIIPWHSSGNSKDVLQSLVASVNETLTESSDYTDTQTDQIKSHKEGKGKNEKTIDDRTEDEIKLWDARVKLLSEGGDSLTEEERNILKSNDFTKELYKRFTAKEGEEGYDPDCSGVTLPKAQAEQIFPYEYWDKNSTRENADVNGQRFAAYCDSLGLVPRFSQFMNEPGYWKLLIDRKMYDNNVMNDDGTVKEYGKYRDQKVVDVTQARMDTDASQELDAKEQRKQQMYQLPESTTAKYRTKENFSEETNRAIEEGNSYLEKKYDGEGSYSAYGDMTDADIDQMLAQADEDYMDAAKRGDVEAAQEAIDFAAQQAGYVLTAFHGTGETFTVFRRGWEGIHLGNIDQAEQVADTRYRDRSQTTDYRWGKIKDSISQMNTEQRESLVKSAYFLLDYMSNTDGLYDFSGDISNDSEVQSYVESIVDRYAQEQSEMDGFTTNPEDINIRMETFDRDVGRKVMKLYARINNPFLINGDINSWTPWNLADVVLKRADGIDTKDVYGEAVDISGSNVVLSEEQRKALEEIANNTDASDETWDALSDVLNDLGFDGIQYLNTYEGDKNSYSYIALKQSDVKLADPITYDDNGEIIPLNQRFNRENDDIRYSAGGEMTDADIDQMLEREGVVQGQSEEQGESNERQSMMDSINSNGWSVNEEYAGYEDYSTVKRVYDENNKVIGILHDDERITIEGGGEKYKRAEQKLQSAGFEKIGNSWYPGEKQQPSRNSAQQNQNKETIPGGEIIETDGGLPSVPNNLPGNPLQTGPFRQFGRYRAQGSDALHQQVKDYLYTHSDYDPETNQEQIGRAVDWVRSNASEGDEDGYRASLDEVLSPGFDYRSADGQARMLTVMGMAALKAESGDRSALNDELRLADAFNRQGTDLGRQLQARKIFRLMTPLGRRQALLQEADRINTDLTNRGKDTQVSLSDWTLKAAESAQSEQDFEKVRKTAEAELAAQIPANWKEKIQTWRMLSMLGNPRTHIRNIVGNAIFMPTVGLKNAIATVLENQLIKEGGERTKAIRYDEDAESFAAQDVVTMKDVLTGEAKYSPENRIDRQKKAFGQGDGIISRTIGRFVQDVADINSDLLEVEDWFFLNRHYQNALASYMTANGLKSEDMTGTTLEKARAYAVLEAQKATYRDANAVSDVLNKWSKTKGGFLVDAVLPFKKTPANILRRGIEYSPVGLIKSFATMKKSVDLYNSWEANGFKGEMPKGAKTMNQAIDSIAAGATGTMIAALGALGYAFGAVKLGFGKKDDDELDQERGSQEYSIELFGQSVTVDWAAPVCMPFFLGASLWQNIAENDGNISLGSVVNAVMGISEPVFNLSMLDGVNSLLETTKYSTNQDSTPIGDILQKVGANYVGSMFPALGGAWARSIDNTRRKNFIQSGDDMSIWTGMVEQVQNKIPGLSMLNIPYRNVWGEADVTPRGEAFLENFVLPGYINHMKEDKLVDELQRIYDQTGDKSVIPKAAGKTAGDIKMTDKEYDKYVVTRGQTAKRLLNELIERPEFIALTPTDVSAGNPEAQVQLIGQVWQYCNAIARHEVDPSYDIGSTGKWIAGAYARDDVIDTIFANEEAKAQKENANAARADLITAINGNDADAIGASVEALKRSGKTTKQIKDNLYDDFRDMYKEAYLNDDYETMDRIKYGMMYADLGDDSIGEKIFQTWAKDAEKKRNQ